MKKKRYQDLLNTSVAEATPEMREDVRNAPIVVTTHLAASPEKEATVKRRRPAFRRGALAACLSMVLVFSVIAAVVLMNPGTPVTPPVNPTQTSDYRSYITVDINPSFSLTVDAAGNVTHVVAENYDGEVVLDSIAAEGESLARPYDTTLRLLLEYAKALGYFTTSDGINVDIYNYNEDSLIKSEMQEHIAAAIHAVGTETLPANIHEMAKSTMISIAKEIYADLAEEAGDDDLFHILEGKRGWGDRRHEAHEEDDPCETYEDSLLELTLLYYSILSLEELAECFENLEIYLTLRGKTAEELFEENGQLIRFVQKRVDALLAWMGDSRTLTGETYEALRAMTEVSCTEEDMDALSDLRDDYRLSDRSAATIELLAERILADQNVSAVYRSLKATHVSTSSTSTFRLVTSLERSWREATHLYGAMNQFFGNMGWHGEHDSDDGHGRDFDEWEGSGSRGLKKIKKI